MADCRRCPFPNWRRPEVGMCSICATLVVDEDGQMYVSKKPLVDNAGKKLTWRQEKALRGRKKK